MRLAALHKSRGLVPRIVRFFATHASPNPAPPASPAAAKPPRECGGGRGVAGRLCSGKREPPRGKPAASNAHNRSVGWHRAAALLEWEVISCALLSVVTPSRLRAILLLPLVAQFEPGRPCCSCGAQAAAAADCSIGLVRLHRLAVILRATAWLPAGDSRRGGCRGTRPGPGGPMVAVLADGQEKRRTRRRRSWPVRTSRDYRLPGSLYVPGGPPQTPVCTIRRQRASALERWSDCHRRLCRAAEGRSCRWSYRPGFHQSLRIARRSQW